MRPEIVCLCGSTRFVEAFRDANLAETLAGHIVLTIGCEWHSDQALGLTEEDKERLDELHLEKIKLANAILVLNVGGYIGQSTAREIYFAATLGKVVRWLEPPQSEEESIEYFMRVAEIGMPWLQERINQGDFPTGPRHPISPRAWFQG